MEIKTGDSILARSLSPNRRESTRHAVTLAGVVVGGAGAQPHHTTVWDVSQSGLQLRSPLRFDCGERIELALAMGGVLVCREGIVRFCRRVTDETGRRYIVGIEIDQ